MASTVTEYAVGQERRTWPPHILWNGFCRKTRAKQELRDQRQRFRKIGSSKEFLAKIILPNGKTLVTDASVKRMALAREISA